MIALALSAALAVTPVQASSPTWLKCDWTETSNTLTDGQLGPDKISKQSRIYQFDPATERLSVYDPETLTLAALSGVIVTDEVVWAETINNLRAPNGLHSEITKDVKIDRRTLSFFLLNT